MENEIVISSDSHVFEPPDLWTERIDAKFKDRAPHMERVGDVDQLVVAQATVGKTLTMRRFRARARGRGTRIDKPVSNLTIVVAEREDED